jgi:hypothetical protein
MPIMSIAVLGLLLSSAIVRAQVPDALRHVPVDAVGFVHVRVGDLLRGDLGKQLYQELQRDREAAKGLKGIEKSLGLQIGDIDSVTILLVNAQGGPPMMRPWDIPGRRPFIEKKFDLDMKKAIDFKFEKDVEEKKPEPPPAKESPVVFQPGRFEHGHFHDLDPRDFDGPFISTPLVIVTSTKDLDRKGILRQQVFAAKPRGAFGPGMSHGPSMLFLSDRSVIVGQTWDLAQYAELMARKETPKRAPMQGALDLAAKPHAVVAGGHMPAEYRRMYWGMLSFGSPDARIMGMLAPLFQTEAALALNVGKTVDVSLQLAAPTDANAAQTMQAMKNLRILADFAIEMENDAGEPVGPKLVFQKRLKAALNGAVLQQKGTKIEAQIKMELDPLLIKSLTKELVATLRQRGDRTVSVNNLKMIGLALHSYHDANKRLPPAGIHDLNDPNGKPLLSWRVAILPYIEYEQLYRQFDLTQPWDHPNNKKLIDKMPPIYVVPGTDNKDGETNYRVLVGPTTMFEPQPGNRGHTLVAITDGTSNTIMVVEAAQPTIWTRPDDLPFNPNGPMPKFGASPDGFNVLMGDGSVRFIRANIDPNTLRAMITRNGGEVFTLPDDR